MDDAKQYINDVIKELEPLGMVDLTEMIISEGRLTEVQFAAALAFSISKCWLIAFTPKAAANFIYKTVSEAYYKQIKTEHRSTH